MAKDRPFGWYVVKATRISGWCLLPLLVGYTLTGWALAGKYGLMKLFGKRAAEVLHLEMDEVFLTVLAVHVAAVAWLTLKRWRWIGRRRRT